MAEIVLPDVCCALIKDSSSCGIAKSVSHDFPAALTSTNKHHRSSSTKSTKLERIDQTSEELEPGYVRVTIKKESLQELQRVMANAGTENMDINSVCAILCQSGILSATFV